MDGCCVPGRHRPDEALDAPARDSRDVIGEAAMLAGLVQRPSDYSPLLNPKAARARQAYVVERMRQDGYISDAVAKEAKEAPLALVEDDIPLNHIAAPYFVEHVRRWAQERFGHHSVFYGGLNIYTTLDMRMQRSAEAAVRDGLEEVDRMIGDFLDETLRGRDNVASGLNP